jgi:Squalene-hopene cyclase C-terminal domain/Prenyltransferase and squalene oxidase repeat
MFGAFTLAVLVLNPDAAPATQVAPEKVRESVEKGVAFLEKDGVAWTEKKKCASCHHIPMMIWSQQEARRRGIKINENALEKATNFALQAQYTNPQNGKPLQEVSTPSPELVHLALALAAAPAPTDAVARKLAEVKAYLLKKQEANGSWMITRADKIVAPIEDTDDVMTMLAVLALSSRDAGAEPLAVAQSRDKALAWLKDSAPGDNLHALALRIVIQQRFGKADQVPHLAKQLLSEQRADGGWGQVKERSSDATATGQALYALAAAGIDTKHDAVQRGLAFLVRTQRDDGSWLVSSRIPKNKETLPSYFGSGWAVIGLAQHVHK